MSVLDPAEITLHLRVASFSVRGGGPSWQAQRWGCFWRVSRQLHRQASEEMQKCVLSNFSKACPRDAAFLRRNLNESSAAAETREDQIPSRRSCQLCCLGPQPLHVLSLSGWHADPALGAVGPVSSRPFPVCPILCPPRVLSMKRLKTPVYKRDIPSKPAISSETKFSLCLKYHFCFHASFLSCRN